jgi:hypothetical protein
LTAGLESEAVTELIRKHPQEALNLIKEWPRWEMAQGQALLARHAWKLGIGTEHMDRYADVSLKLIREIIRRVNTEDITEKFMDFVTGKEGADLYFTLSSNTASITEGLPRLAMPFDGLRDFAPRVVRAVSFHDLYDIALFEIFGNGTERGRKEGYLPVLTEYLIKNGASEEEIWKRDMLRIQDDGVLFKFVMENKDAFRRVVSTVGDQCLYRLFRIFEYVERPDDLDLFFDEYVSRIGTEKYSSEWKDEMESIALNVDKDILKAAFTTHPKKIDIIKFAKSEMLYYTEEFLGKLGVPPEKNG